MTDLLTMLLSLLTAILPDLLTKAGVSTQVISLLEAAVPLAIKEATAVLPALQGLIATLSGSPTLTADDWTRIKALDAQIDASFDKTMASEGF